MLNDLSQKELTLFTQALSDADRAFFGKTDKSGRPAIMHSLRLARLFWNQDNYLLATIAVLHDILEDTDYSRKDLITYYPEDIANAVIALTRNEGEIYRDYLSRCCENPLACIVKYYDIQDNLDPVRCAGWMPPYSRYNKSLDFILENYPQYYDVYNIYTGQKNEEN